MKANIKRGDIYWAKLDPTLGTEIMKTRPVLIISNDIANEFSSRIIVAPITSRARKVFPFEVAIEIQQKQCKILLDQIRAIDKIRLGKKLTSCTIEIIEQVNEALKVALALI